MNILCDTWGDCDNPRYQNKDTQEISIRCHVGSFFSATWVNMCVIEVGEEHAIYSFKMLK